MGEFNPQMTGFIVCVRERERKERELEKSEREVNERRERGREMSGEGKRERWG